MMKKVNTIYHFRSLRGRFLAAILALIAFMMGAAPAMAQNVSIDLVHGSLLAAMTDQGETGSSQGFKALWRHEQLALSMTGTDRDGLTATGEISEPSAVFGQRNGKIFISGGRRPSFIVVSLPKGYRITGYTLVLANDLVGQGNSNVGTGNFANINSGNGFVSQVGETEATMRFYEVKPWETDGTNSGTEENRGTSYPGYTDNQVRYLALGTDYDYVNNNPQSGGTIGTAQSDIWRTATAADGDTDINPSDAGKKFTISRTATQDENTKEWDMGNQIYFRLVKDYYYYGLTIESFEIRFTAEGTFEANVKPTEASSTAVSVDSAAFKTNKIDIGEMTNNTQPGTSNTQFSYVWGNVTDLEAFNYIYQDDAYGMNSALGGNVPKEGVAQTKNIYKVDNGGGNYWYGLKNDIYFVEPPILIKNKAGNMCPIGYRIVGAKINYALGSEDYYIQLYDRTGAKITTADGLIEVNSSNATGSKDLGLLNNDAIKFEILRKNADGELIPFSQNGMALITVDLYLQALNPYIDKMDIVCHDNRDVLQLTQSFTADNFSVAGDRFIFYVPEDYGNEDLTFTFSGLYSKYGDETYYDRGEGSARYSFVRSDYFIPVDGNGNKGLYDTAYDPNHTYTDKVSTSNAGKYRFKFNNAEDLARPDQTSGNLIEYPFSVKTYLNTENPGDPTAYYPVAASSDKGEFIDCVLNASKNDQKSGTYYVFTADETRWNIAPTDGWQHRFYAFYRMEIELRAKTFTPKLDYTKIYDKTFYNDGTGDKEDSMWGLTLDVADEENGQKVTGYLTYQEILDHIQGREGVKFTQEEIDAAQEGDPAYGKTTNDWKITPITKTLKDDNSTAPASMKQILYVDGTPLYAMLNSSQNSVYKKLEDLQKELNKNSLVFLPENTTSTLDNVAYETSSTESTSELQAGGDIVLTDKIPFYTPYDIQVDAANTTTYTRMISAEENGQADYATIIVPFALTVDDNGIHTNPDGSQFSVNVMYNGQEMKLQPGSAVDHGTAFFKPLKNAGSTVANTPYMVSIMSRGTLKDGENFVVEQNGASIAATPTNGATNEFGTGWMHKGKTTAKATFDEKEYNFTNVATFSGAKFDRNLSENVFYFAAGKYLDLHTLAASAGPYLYVYPFRNVFTYPDNGAWVSRASAAKAMKWFDISFDEPNHSSIVTEVDNIANADLMVKVGKGVVTLSATRSQDVNISTLSGMNMKRVALDAGNTQNIVLPAGIYLINNVKVIVK